MTDIAARSPRSHPLLPWLWAAVLLNMLLADVLSLYVPGSQQAAVDAAGSTSIRSLMLVSAAVIELPVVAMLLTQVLRPRVARWVHLGAALACVAFVVGGGVGYPHYVFIATVEILCLALIVWLAWRRGEVQR